MHMGYLHCKVAVASSWGYQPYGLQAGSGLQGCSIHPAGLLVGQGVQGRLAAGRALPWDLGLQGPIASVAKGQLLPLSPPLLI